MERVIENFGDKLLKKPPLLVNKKLLVVMVNKHTPLYCGIDDLQYILFRLNRLNIVTWYSMAIFSLLSNLSIDREKILFNDNKVDLKSQNII